MLRIALQDLHYASRFYLRRPGFVLRLIVILALGIGATLTVFGFIESVLLRPLPYRDPDRLAVVWDKDTTTGVREPVSVPDYFDWTSQNEVFEVIAAFMPWEANLTGMDTPPQRVGGGSVTHPFFSLLGVEPILGRTFTAEDDRPESAPVMILDNKLWHQRFGGRKDVLGELLYLDDVAYEVIGVLPPDFISPGGLGELCWYPLRADPAAASRDRHSLYVLGRLREGLTLDRAGADLEAILRRATEAEEGARESRGIDVALLYDEAVGDSAPKLWTLFAAVICVLLVACGNMALLMLSQGLARQKEIALRRALGMGRARLLGQFLLEGILLTLPGAALGLALAYSVLGILPTVGFDGAIPRMNELQVGALSWGVSIGLLILTAALCSLMPVVQWNHSSLLSSLRSAEKGSLSGALQRTLRRGFVVSQLALATVLVIGAGLLVKSFQRLQDVDLGFRADRLLAVEITLPASRYPFPSFSVYPEWPEMSAFYSRLLDETRNIPGIEEVSVAVNHPLKPGWTNKVTFDDRPPEAREEGEDIRIRAVSPDYFRTAGIPLIRGRAFSEADSADGQMVVIANDSFVNRYFGDGNAVGRKISFWGRSREIVGVSGNVRFLGVGEDVPPALYAPFLQVPIGNFHILAHTRGAPEDVTANLREKIWSIDPDLAVYNVQSLGKMVSDSFAQPRFHILFLGAFSVMALALALVGIYGLIAHSVEQRTAEIGVRMTLGGQKKDILAMILGEGARLILPALALGTVLAYFLRRLISHLLFEVDPGDPWVFSPILLVMALVALIACLIPSYRATRIDPAMALRHE